MYPRRVKRRYIALRVLGDGAFAFKDIMGGLQGELLRLYGEYGVGKANLQLMEFDDRLLVGVVRCNSSSLIQVRAAIAALTEVAGKPAALHSLGVSGTIKALRRKFLQRAAPKNAPTA